MRFAFYMASITWFFLAGSAARGQSILNVDHPHIEGEFLIQLDEPLSVKGTRRLLGDLEILWQYQTVPAVLVKVKKSQQPALNALLGHEGVRSIEVNQYVFATGLPNDPELHRQYGLHNTGQTGGLAGADIGARKAWRESTGAPEVLVAVIDSGIDYLHQDIAANYRGNPLEQGLDSSGNDKRFNAIDDDDNGFVDDHLGWNFVANNNDPMDDNGFSHGTHCAGVIGAVGDNGTGVSGVNWTVGLVAVKFLDAAGRGSIADAIKAVEYATSIGASLTNNSWGGGGYSPLMVAAIEAAHESGVLFFAASGNSGLNTDLVAHYPSSYRLPNIVAVAATDHRDELADFSNYGVETVHIAAPGKEIYSTVRGNQYKALNGTSMATPFVAGAAALLMSRYPELPPQAIRSRLLDAGDRLTSLKDKTSRAIRLNIGDAIADDQLPPSPVDEVLVGEITRQEVVLRWPHSGDDGDLGRARRYEVRVSPAPIETEEQWDEAKRGRTEELSDFDADDFEVRLWDLPFNFSGYVAVRAFDKVSNISPLGASTKIDVVRVHLLFEEQAESLANVEVSGGWGIEFDAMRQNHVFSLSPDRPYPPNALAILELPKMDLSAARDPTLLLWTRHDIERGYDFGYVEVAYGQGEWELLQRLSDKREWRRLSWPLRAEESVRVRFRFTSDDRMEHDGWWIDDIVVIGE